MWYIDEYGAVDLEYCVSVVAFDPCTDHDRPDWAIGCLLAFTQEVYPVTLRYPTQGLRNAALEKLLAKLILVAELEEAAFLDDEDGA